MKVCLSIDEMYPVYSLDIFDDDSMTFPGEVFKVSRLFWMMYRISEIMYVIFQGKLKAMEMARYRESRQKRG